MSLVLSVEPDRAQAAQIEKIAARLGADLILVGTTTEASRALGKRVPDLVLVPALLSPKEDAALTSALRSVAGDAPVRLLITPAFSTGASSVSGGRVPKWLRRRKEKAASPDGCDPELFAEQIAGYLEEAGRQATSTILSEPGPSRALSVGAQAESLASLLEPPRESFAESTAESVFDSSLESLLNPRFESSLESWPETTPSQAAPIADSLFVGSVQDNTEADESQNDGAQETHHVGSQEIDEVDHGFDNGGVFDWTPALASAAAEPALPPPSDDVIDDNELVATVPIVTRSTRTAGANESEWQALIASLHNAVDGFRIEEWLTGAKQPPEVSP